MADAPSGIQMDGLAEMGDGDGWTLEQQIAGMGLVDLDVQQGPRSGPEILRTMRKEESPTALNVSYGEPVLASVQSFALTRSAGRQCRRK